MTGDAFASVRVPAPSHRGHGRGVEVKSSSLKHIQPSKLLSLYDSIDNFTHDFRVQAQQRLVCWEARHPAFFRLNDKESECMAATPMTMAAIYTLNAHFGFNERINDAFTKRERGEGEQKDGKEGREGECVNVG